MNIERKEVLTVLAAKMVSGYNIPGTKGDDKATPVVKATNTRIYCEIEGLVGEEVKDGKKVLVPQVVAPKVINDLAEMLYTEMSDEPQANPTSEDVLAAVAEYKGSKFISVLNRKIEGFTSLINSRPGVVEPQEIFFLAKAVFANMYTFVKENIVEKTADPDLQAKRAFCGSYKAAEIKAMKDSEIVPLTLAAIQAEVDKLQTLMLAVEKVSPADYRAFCSEKEKANGIDPKTEKIRLKAEKSEKKDEKKSEAPKDEAPEQEEENQFSEGTTED